VVNCGISSFLSIWFAEEQDSSFGSSVLLPFGSSVLLPFGSSVLLPFCSIVVLPFCSSVVLLVFLRVNFTDPSVCFSAFGFSSFCPMVAL
jgi:hypothetical protein